MGVVHNAICDGFYGCRPGRRVRRVDRALALPGRYQRMAFTAVREVVTIPLERMPNAPPPLGGRVA